MMPPGMTSKKRTAATNLPGRVVPPSEKRHKRQSRKRDKQVGDDNPDVYKLLISKRPQW